MARLSFFDVHHRGFDRKKIKKMANRQRRGRIYRQRTSVDLFFQLIN